MGYKIKNYENCLISVIGATGNDRSALTRRTTFCYIGKWNVLVVYLYLYICYSSKFEFYHYFTIIFIDITSIHFSQSKGNHSQL